MVNVFPLPSNAPPTADEYHLICPALAVAFSTNADGRQLAAGLDAVMVGKGLMMAETGTLGAEVQILSLTSTQYHVVVDNAGVVKVFPVVSAVPPVESANQLMVPLAADADRFTVPEPQAMPWITELITGIGRMVAVTAEREVLLHPLAYASA